MYWILIVDVTPPSSSVTSVVCVTSPWFFQFWLLKHWEANSVSSFRRQFIQITFFYNCFVFLKQIHCQHKRAFRVEFFFIWISRWPFALELVTLVELSIRRCFSISDLNLFLDLNDSGIQMSLSRRKFKIKYLGSAILFLKIKPPWH